MVSTESWPMRLAGSLGAGALRWALRRLHCPVISDGLVLEVGAGGNPYPRANVLLEGFEESWERAPSEQALVRDRPLVMGLCERLPFRDKAFDFVIASHVLEHTDRPDQFLAELMRVARAGYIETPHAWFERWCPYMYHRLECWVDGPRLVMRKKTSWISDPEGADLWDLQLRHNRKFRSFITRYPDVAHVRYYWEDTIDYRVVNPDADASWPEPPANPQPEHRPTFKDRLRDRYLAAARRMFSQGRRNRTLRLIDMLRCPDCFSTELAESAASIECRSCGRHYPVVNGVPNMFPGVLEGANLLRLQKTA